MTKPVLISCFGLECLDFEESSAKVKSRAITCSDLEQYYCPRPFRYRFCKYFTFVYQPSHPLREIANWALWFVPVEAQSACKKYTATEPIMHEMRLKPLNVCLTVRRLNQLS